MCNRIKLNWISLRSKVKMQNATFRRELFIFQTPERSERTILVLLRCARVCFYSRKTHFQYVKTIRPSTETWRMAPETMRIFRPAVLCSKLFPIAFSELLLFYVVFFVKRFFRRAKRRISTRRQFIWIIFSEILNSSSPTSVIIIFFFHAVPSNTRIFYSAALYLHDFFFLQIFRNFFDFKLKINDDTSVF